MLKAKGYYKRNDKICVELFKYLLYFNSHVPKMYNICIA